MTPLEQMVPGATLPMLTQTPFAQLLNISPPFVHSQTPGAAVHEPCDEARTIMPFEHCVPGATDCAAVAVPSELQSAKVLMEGQTIEPGEHTA